MAVECKLPISPSYCIIENQINLGENEELEISPPPALPQYVHSFNVKSPASLKRFPQKIFNALPELKEVNLEDAGIDTLTQNAFDAGGSLENLNLKRNKLEIIEDSVFIHLSSLDSLQLSENKIHEIQDNAFKGLKKLRTLKLNGNQLKIIRRNTLADLESLEYLHLYANQIETIESGALNLPKLIEAFFTDNKIKVLPDDLFSQTPLLEIIELRNNELKTIGNAFANCHKVYSIALENNDQLEDGKLSKFARLGGLLSLSLNNTGLKISKDDVNEEKLGGSPVLRLNLANNKLSDPNIFYHLSVFPELKHVDLYNNNFEEMNNSTDDEIRKYLPKLETVDLKNNLLKVKLTLQDIKVEL